MFREQYSMKIVVGILWINGGVAAFFNGYISADEKQIFVPRLSINESYAFYSPGYVLINETIRSFQENGYRIFNLDRGSEKYKTDMGGHVYKTMSYEMREE